MERTALILKNVNITNKINKIQGKIRIVKRLSRSKKHISDLPEKKS